MHCEGTRLDPPTVDMQSSLLSRRCWHWGAHWLCLLRFELELEHRISSEFRPTLCLPSGKELGEGRQRYSFFRHISTNVLDRRSAPQFQNAVDRARYNGPAIWTESHTPYN